ncbi:MAG TPA: hypothetical protein VG276_27795 [Actinomycetes bacterium]|nr:hypothetical protein [Actinomycetes bacterium]
MTYPEGEPGVVDLGERHFAMALITNDAVVGYLWWHDCTTEPKGWSWLGQWGDRRSGHQIVDTDPVHIEPSILCPQGCGDHGFVREGRWVPA